jgi:acetyl-CoA synthetase
LDSRLIAGRGGRDLQLVKAADFGGDQGMSDAKVYKVPADWKKRAYFDNDAYLKAYTESVKSPDKFWAKQGKRIDWFKPFSKVKNVSYAYPKVSIKWYEDGVTNVAWN